MKHAKVTNSHPAMIMTIESDDDVPASESDGSGDEAVGGGFTFDDVSWSC